MTARGNIEQQIVALGRLMTLCFVAMALGVGYWSILRSPALVARDDNPRYVEAERRIRRGDILDRNGQPLVRSESGPSGTWERVYLVPEAAPVVGYASIDLGTGGIEASYNGELRGDRAKTPAEQWRDRLLHIHSHGVDVLVSLDAETQRTATQALGDRTGAVVLLDARTGDILAMVSQPTFDPNTLEEDWPQLQYNPDKPMLNRAVQGLYPPGLVFETLTLAAALEEGLAQPTTVYTDPLGVVLDVEPPISCPTDPPKETFTLAEAYTWPCSVLFARLGLQLGGDQLANHITRLGIGRPIDLPLELSSGQILERGVWTDLIVARTAMGRGEVLVTPIEMAVVVAAVANDGTQASPRLILQIEGQPAPAPTAPRQVLTQETAQHIQAILAQAVAVHQDDIPLSASGIAGRAGTADSGLPGAPPHAWFVGFAPVEKPRYAVAVIVEHGSEGWQVAAPIGIQTLNQAVAAGE